MAGVTWVSEPADGTFTRPANTTPYSVGDLVANHGTAGSVALLSWSLPAGGVFLRRITLRKSDPDAIAANFRLWLVKDSAITFSNGDNGALAIGSSTLAIADILGVFNIDIDASLTGAGDVGVATFDENLVPLANTPNQNNRCTIYGFLEARAAYTPGSEEVFSIALRGDSI